MFYTPPRNPTKSTVGRGKGGNRRKTKVNATSKLVAEDRDEEKSNIVSSKGSRFPENASKIVIYNDNDVSSHPSSPDIVMSGDLE